MAGKGLTSAAGGPDDVPGSAKRTITPRDAGLAVALSSELVALVAHAAVGVAQTRLARDALQRVAEVAVVALAAALAPIAAGARAALRAVAQQMTRVGEVALDRRTGARPAAARLARVAVIAFSAQVTSISGRVVAATL